MRVRANAWRSLTGEALSQPSRPNEGGAARMCPGPALYRRACVWEAVFSVGSWKHSSCCREKGGGGKVQAQAASVQGLSSCRVKAPIERKRGSSQQCSGLVHARTYTGHSRTTLKPA